MLNFRLKNYFVSKKIIIWGHKPQYHHTHSFIHSSYYKAFKAIGFDVSWYDDLDTYMLRDMDLSDCIFFTEGQVSNEIPLIKGAIYILHHCDNEKYLNAGGIVLNLCNYLKYCEEGKSFNYDGNSVQKIDDLVFFDSMANALYQPWATDLLPYEINNTNPVIFDPKKNVVNYIGSIWSENHTQIIPFVEACKQNNKEFKHYWGGVSDEDNKRLIRDSYIAPDIRGEWHKECGYLPCRIFKNMSYGQVTGTNSAHVAKVFEGRIAYSEDTRELFNACVEKGKNSFYSEMIDNMEWIRDNHTYINRISSIFYTLGEMM